MSSGFSGSVLTIFVKTSQSTHKRTRWMVLTCTPRPNSAFNSATECSPRNA
ncbi:hypothetical protein F441_13519, partial [Phytophthora nicotianae CJ01A1]